MSALRRYLSPSASFRSSILSSNVYRSRSPVLQVKRPFIPLVGAGLAVILVGTVASYGIRAFDRMREEQENNAGGTGSEESDTSSSSSNQNISYLGLDLGSTYSKLAHIDNSNTSSNSAANIATLIQNAEGRRAVPCYVHQLPDGKFAVGHLARAARFLKPKHTAFSPSLLTGSMLIQQADVEAYAAAQTMLADIPFSLKEEGVSLGGDTPLPLSAILELVAADMFRVSLDQGITSSQVNVSYPSFFSVDACLALEDACLRAGAHVIDLVPDPVSAYIGAVESGTHAPGYQEALAGNTVSVAVVDVGGRMSQMGLLKITKSKSGAGISVSLVNERTGFIIGGEWADEAIVKHIAARFKEKNGVDLLVDPQAKQRLYDAAEAAKMDLSRTKQTQINIPYITATPKGTLHIDQSMTRAQLESLLEGQESAAIKSLKDLLFDPNNSGDAPLVGVLLAGGGSRMHFVKRVVEKVTGMVAVEAKEPEALIAIGAAAYARYIE